MLLLLLPPLTCWHLSLLTFKFAKLWLDAPLMRPVKLMSPERAVIIKALSSTAAVSMTTAAETLKSLEKSCGWPHFSVDHQRNKTEKRSFFV